ncbi:MAG: nuclear transport factor 2 family protein [Pyrinomonadaceae bacterium]
MTKTPCLFLTVAAALVFAACGAPTGNAPTNSANAANAPAKPAAAPPAKDALMAVETKAWQAWKAKDGKFFEGYLAENAIGMGNGGRSDKAANIKRISDPSCDVRDVSFSDEQLRLLGADAALLTYKANQDAKCGGKALPAAVRAATILVGTGDNWKAAFHAEAAVVDPKAVAANVSPKGEQKPAATDTLTVALLPAEKALWEAWKDHDAKRIEELTTDDVSFINIFGTYFPTRAEALKDWTSPGCDVKSVSVTDAAAISLSPDAAVLTFKGGADGTCFGQAVGPIWGTSIYVKDGDKWKWTFGINLPAL